MAERLLLRDLLQEELAVLEEMCNLSVLKTEIIMKDDMVALEEIVFKEEALAKKLKVSDNACSAQVQNFLAAQNSGAPEAFSAEITGLLDQMKNMAAQIKLNNDLNQHLIYNSLTLIQFSLNSLLTSMSSNAGCYGSSGKLEANQKNTILLDVKG